MLAIVIDDEVLAVEYISRLLKKSGFTVFGFTNPYEALGQAEVRQADVFYLDIEMPGINGLKVAEEIHAVNADCEVVFITGHNQYALEAFDVNAIDYLLKPVSSRQIERSLERINKRRGINGLSHINVSLFGKTSLQINNRSKSIRFMTVKVAEVFCYMLLQKSGAEISKWKLIDEIWPDKDIGKGDINMRSTISRMNKTFRENDIHIAMKSTRNGYQLEIAEEIEVDAFLLEKIADKNHVITENNLLSYEMILLRYNDMFLEDFDNEWCKVFRTLYNRYFKIAVHKLINYYKEGQQDSLRILNIIERLTIYEPYDDEIRELALKLYYSSYGKSGTIKYYEEYIKLLRDDLDIQPSEKLKDCYGRLIQTGY